MSNPPYGRLTSGRVNPVSEKAIARHELFGTLADVIQTAAKLLPRKGRLALIYPAKRLAGLLEEVSAGRFAPEQLTFIHATRNSEAKLIHLESIKEGGGEYLKVRKPFIIYRSDGTYTDEMNTMYRNGPSDA
jgi:tRNA1Val (adenine37-N6)-methyltransferase